VFSVEIQLDAIVKALYKKYNVDSLILTDKEIEDSNNNTFIEVHKENEVNTFRIVRLKP